MENNLKKYDEGIELLKAGKYDRALSIFNELVAKFPNNADNWSERGVIHFHLNHRELSLSDMNKAAELQPNKSYRYASRAYIKGHYKMTHEAIADYQKAIELDPEDAVALNNLGLIEEQLGYNRKAQQYFTKADELADGVNGRTNLGKQGKQIEARNIQKEIDQENAQKTIWSELKTLSNKEGRKSFFKFLRSGFKNT